jgi:hypothetical protein
MLGPIRQRTTLAPRAANQENDPNHAPGARPPVPAGFVQVWLLSGASMSRIRMRSP